jgi:hypothetical protein
LFLQKAAKRRNTISTIALNKIVNQNQSVNVSCSSMNAATISAAVAASAELEAVVNQQQQMMKKSSNEMINDEGKLKREKKTLIDIK